MGTLQAGLTAVPLFHAAWLFAAGIVVASRVWLRPSLVLIALALVAALCGVAALRAQRIAWLPLAVLWLLLGAWCAEMEPHPAPAPELAALSDGLLRTVEGTVVDAGPVRTETGAERRRGVATAPSQRIDLRVATLEVVTDESDAQAPVSGGVRLTVRWPADAAATRSQAFRCGERVRAVVRLLPPETYHDPGVWSRADYLLDQGITSTATVAIDRVERLGQAHAGAFFCVPGERHGNMRRRQSCWRCLRPCGSCRAPLRLSEDDAVMLAAMVAGDRTYLTHSLRVGFERTGSFHMLVVSGFHLAIVAACIFWITRRLRLPRVPATFLTIAASFAYALFTGFATPVQRSLWMVTLYLLGRLVYRERSPLNTIGFAALCLLVVSPRSLFDSSLQMTLLAVIAIAGVAAPLLQGTIHPYAAATRDLRLVAMDIKLAPKLAEFRVMMRMIAERLERAAKQRDRVAYFSLERALCDPRGRVGGGFVRGGAGDDAADGRLLPSHHDLRSAGESAYFAAAGGADAGGAADAAALVVWPAAAVVPAVVVALVLHIGVGLVHLFGSMALGDFRIPGPLLVAIGGVLRAAWACDLFWLA